MKRIILASASPRRKELIKLICADAECIPADIEEVVPDGTPLESYAAVLAEQKAAAIAERFPDAAVIGCDTVVIIDGRLLGKPKTEAEAAHMLSALSGRTHTVITGVCVISGGERTCFSEHTDVTFRELSESEISAYVASGEPMDKAGAYGIQGPGAVLVKGINGDFYNVMGLPVARLNEVLMNERIISR